ELFAVDPGPAGGVVAGLADDPAADVRRNRAGRQRVDEVDRQQQATLGVAPPQQRLGAEGAAGVEVDLRLVVHLELALRVRAAQLQVEHPAMVDLLPHAGIEPATAAAASGLGFVERKVCAGDQFAWATGL